MSKNFSVEILLFEGCEFLFIFPSLKNEFEWISEFLSLLLNFEKSKFELELIKHFLLL